MITSTDPHRAQLGRPREFTDAQIARIRKLLALGWGHRQIAIDVGCARSYVSHIKTGRARGGP